MTKDEYDFMYEVWRRGGNPDEIEFDNVRDYGEEFKDSELDRLAEKEVRRQTREIIRVDDEEEEEYPI